MNDRLGAPGLWGSTWLSLAIILGLSGLSLTPQRSHAAEDKAAEAQAIFNDLFGGLYNGAKSTATKTDDVELAGYILKTIPEAKSEPALFKLLCEKVIELAATSPAGKDMVRQANDFLLPFKKTAPTVTEKKVEVPAQAPASEKADLLAQITSLKRDLVIARTVDAKKVVGQKMVDVYLKLAVLTESDPKTNNESLDHYKRAATMSKALKLEGFEKIDQTYRAAMNRKLLAGKISKLQSKLLEKPDDAASAQSLVMIYLLEQYDPQQAALYATVVTDDALRQVAMVAAKPINERTDKELVELAQWYKDISLRVPASQKLNAYKQSFLSAQTVLNREGSEARDRIAATMVASHTSDMLTKLGQDVERLQIELRRAAEPQVAGGTGMAGTAANPAASQDRPAWPESLLKDRVASYSFGNADFLSGTENKPEVMIEEDGFLGRSIKFSAEGYALVPDEPKLNIPGPMSISAWVKVNLSSDWAGLAGRGYGNGGVQYSISTHGDSVVFQRHQVREGAAKLRYVKSLASLKRNTWYHVTGVDDGQTMKIYINGALSYTKNTTGVPSVTFEAPRPLHLGAKMSSVTSSYDQIVDGAVDEVNIWKRALSPEEVRAVFIEKHLSKDKDLHRMANDIVLANDFDFKTASGNYVNTISSDEANNRIVPTGVKVAQGSGVIGQAVNLKADASLQVEAPIDMGQGYSFTVMVKVPRHYNSATILSNGKTFLSIYSGNFRFTSYVGDRYVYARGPKVDPGKWYVITCTDSGEQMKLIVNGRSYKYISKLQPGANAGKLTLGSTSEKYNFDGQIDEFAFWDRPLSYGEARTLHYLARTEGGYIKALAIAKKSGVLPAEIPMHEASAPAPAAGATPQVIMGPGKTTQITAASHLAKVDKPTAMLYTTAQDKRAFQAGLKGFPDKLKAIATSSFARIHGENEEKSLIMINGKRATSFGKAVNVPEGVYSGTLTVKASNLKGGATYAAILFTERGAMDTTFKLAPGTYAWRLVRSGTQSYKSSVRLEILRPGVKKPLSISPPSPGAEVKKLVFAAAVTKAGDVADISIRYNKTADTTKMEFDDKTKAARAKNRKEEIERRMLKKRLEMKKRLKK